MKIIIPFTSPELHALDQVGGKALTLMQMTAAGMPVPPGFVLTVQFFEPWLEMLKKSPAWKNLTKTDELSQAVKALQVLCGTLELTGDQKNALHEALKTFREHNHGHLFAVRSSSPEEDLEGPPSPVGTKPPSGCRWTASRRPSAIRSRPVSMSGSFSTKKCTVSASTNPASR